MSLGTKLGQQKIVERITERKKIETKVEKIVGIKLKRRKKKMSGNRRDKHPKATEKSRKK